MILLNEIPEMEDPQLKSDPRTDGTVSSIYQSISQLVNHQLPTAYLDDDVDFIGLLSERVELHMTQLLTAMLSSRFYRDDDEVLETIRPTLDEFKSGSAEHQNLMLKRSKAGLIPHGGRCKCGYCCLYRTWVAWNGLRLEIDDVRGPMSIELFLMVASYTERIQVLKEDDNE